MGSEAICALTFQGRTAQGKALLETDEVVFRSPGLRLRLAFRDLRRVDVEAGHLVLTGPDGEVRIALGPVAARWAEKIRNPPTLLDKLGIKPHARVTVLSVDDRAFLDALAKSGADVSPRLRKESDVVLLQVDAKADLARVAKLAPYLATTGGLWIIHPKGREDLRDTDVIAAGKKAGLVDNKTSRFSATHTALRFAVPKAKR